MAQDIPDDVWIQVAESAWSDDDRGALHNMSLTSRRIHRLVVSVLFRNLSFERLGFPEQSEALMVELIRDSMRAQFLVNSPELLRHTRFFSFREQVDTVESIAEYLEDSDGSSSRGEAENWVVVVHETIFRLLFRMPGLQELHLYDTALTPLCYAAISSRPLLNSLALEPWLVLGIKPITPALPYALRLRDFDYYCDPWIGNNHSLDPYLIDILDHCILKLERLGITSILLPLVVSRIPLHQTLSLRSLTVSARLFDGLAAAAFLQLLRASPQLQHLDHPWELPDIELTHNLPPFSLPNLSTFSGTPRLLQRLSEGTNLVKIDLHDRFYLEEQPLTQVIRSSPTHLREFSMRHVIVSETPREFLTLVRSIAVFRHLVWVNIAYEHNTPWKDHVSVQDSHSVIKDLLSQLACLRYLDISCDPFGLAAQGYDIGCPISKQGEPADRGHPSLEALDVDFLCGMWSWDSQRGW